jgi:hypothetical protein
MALCSAIRKDGGRCRAQAMSESAYCLNHAPNAEELRKRRASKGGSRAGRGRPMAEVHTIKGHLRELADDVLEHRVERGDAIAVNQLYQTVLKAITTELRIHEQLELVERMEALEEALAQRKTQYGA